MSSQILLKQARALVLGDAGETVLRDVDLLIEGPAIKAIGPHCQAHAAPDASVIDAQKWVIYPGLVNTHHHFFQAFVRNLRGLSWPKPTLLEWLERIYQIFQLIDEDCVYHGSRVSMAELIKHGCTTTLDHMYCHNRHAGAYLIDRQFQAAAEMGMRFHAGRGCNTLPASQGSTMPASMVETTEHFLADCERLIQRYHDPDPFSMRQVVVAPCQPVNCYEATFVEALALARQHKVYLHTHLGEGENAAMLARTGLRSLAWCERLGFVGEDIFLAHGWEFTRAELASLAASKTGLVHCPAPIFLVGNQVTDLCAAHALQVRIGLAVDGQGSNDNGNLLECVRSSYQLQSLFESQRQDPLPPAASYLAWATRGSADLLGRAQIGQLALGMAADLFAVDIEQAEYVACQHDPIALPAKVGISGPVALTMINGQVVWRDGAFTQVEEAALVREANAVFARVIGSSAPFQRETQV